MGAAAGGSRLRFSSPAAQWWQPQGAHQRLPRLRRRQRRRSSRSRLTGAASCAPRGRGVGRSQSRPLPCGNFSPPIPRRSRRRGRSPRRACGETHPPRSRRRGRASFSDAVAPAKVEQHACGIARGRLTRPPRCSRPARGHVSRARQGRQAPAKVIAKVALPVDPHKNAEVGSPAKVAKRGVAIHKRIQRGRRPISLSLSLFLLMEYLLPWQPWQPPSEPRNSGGRRCQGDLGRPDQPWHNHIFTCPPRRP